MTFNVGEEVMIVTPRGMTGVSFGSWDFNTDTPIPGRIVDSSDIYMKKFGCEYLVLPFNQPVHRFQWVPASALAKIEEATDRT